MPRTGLSPDQIKEKAIEATLKKIRKVGFEKVRLAAIAKEMGVSHAALYAHFSDKSALLDAVSARWLSQLDEELEIICQKRKDPAEKLRRWALALHEAKISKVRRDPEFYRAFDMAAEARKLFVKRHLETMERQLFELVRELVEKKRVKSANVSELARIIQGSLVGFHHPRLVSQHIAENREKLLIRILDTVLTGLRLG